MRPILKLAGAALLLMFCACSTPAVITDSWRRPDFPAGTYNNIFVAAVTGQVGEKQVLENDLQQILEQMGLKVEKSMDVFPPKFKDNAIQKQNIAISAVKPTGADGILTITILRKEMEPYFDPLPSWAPLGEEYVRSYEYRYGERPENFQYDGSYRDDIVYYVETNFYNVKSEKLVWTADSKTYDPNNMEGFVKGYVASIFERMQKDGVMIPHEIKM